MHANLIPVTMANGMGWYTYLCEMQIAADVAKRLTAGRLDINSLTLKLAVHGC